MRILGTKNRYGVPPLDRKCCSILKRHGFYQVEASHGPPLLLSQSQAVSSKPVKQTLVDPPSSWVL
jgi:hypothetical protein